MDVLPDARLRVDDCTTHISAAGAGTRSVDRGRSTICDFREGPQTVSEERMLRIEMQLLRTVDAVDGGAVDGDARLVSHCEHDYELLHIHS